MSDFHYFRAQQPGFTKNDVFGPFDTPDACERARKTLIQKRFKVGMPYQTGRQHGKIYNSQDNMWLLDEEDTDG